jgi:hypothetical protein
MTPEEENELAERILGAGTSAFVIPDAVMGSNWISGKKAAVDLARGTGLPPLTQSELAIAANVAGILGGYRSRRTPTRGTWH